LHPRLAPHPGEIALPRARFLLLIAALLCESPAAAAGDSQPAVARPQLGPDAASGPQGLVFFIPAGGEAGAAAVGTAHGADLRALARAGRVEFRLGASGRLVASSRGFLVAPGRPFNAPGSSLRGDFAVYAIEAPPAGARVLEPELRGALAPGSRVRLLGLTPGGPRDWDSVRGSVVRVTHTRIEVDLDLHRDLRGWGGGPVLSARTGRVVGILEARWDNGTSTRIGVAPIGGVLAALASPLDGGAGRAFARFAVGSADPPPAAPAPSSGAQSQIEPLRTRAGRRVADSGTRGVGPEEPTRVHLEVEYPTNGASVGDSICGVFVAGRALAHQGALPRFDVALVIDTSESTRDPSGADVDGDGTVGKPHPGAVSSLFGDALTDRGDSILAAEIAAASRLLRGLDPRSTRVAVVTFAGEPPGSRAALSSRPPTPAAILRAPLSSDYPRVERAFREIFEQEPAGATDMAAGVDLATRELLARHGAYSSPDPAAEKIVLFFTDGKPTLPHPGFEADNVRAVLRAAERARAGNVRIHSFAIGPDALEGPIAAMEMARRTGGFFTPVRHPGDLRSVVEEVSFVSLSDISVRSAATGARARPFRTSADGSWNGLLRMPPGRGQIDIVARAADGAEARETLHVRVDPSAGAPSVSPELAARRNRLLEECLLDAKRARRGAEQQEAEELRKQLRVQIEQERKQAHRRAANQGKQLQIEIEDTPAP
jgi:hypothetical protein